MNEQQKAQVISALVDFVIRASEKNARPEEVQVLPASVDVLVKLCDTKCKLDTQGTMLAPGTTIHL